MKVGGKGVLALSLALGIATSYMVYQYVAQASQAAKPVPTVTVLTAAKNIPARTTITGDMLSISRVPVALKLPSALDTPVQALGKVTKLPISQGEEVLTNKLFADRQQSGLAFLVPEGKRAVAVAVNEVVGSGGMILPGDYVDVVAVLNTTPSTAPVGPGSPTFGATPAAQAQIKAVAQYILQDVEVLAVAQQLEGTPAALNPAQQAAHTVAPNPNAQLPRQSANVQPKARTVTLAVDPADAETLILAEDKGSIRLVLRAHGDTSKLKLANDGLIVNLDGAAALKTEPKPL